MSYDRESSFLPFWPRLYEEAGSDSPHRTHLPCMECASNYLNLKRGDKAGKIKLRTRRSDENQTEKKSVPRLGIEPRTIVYAPLRSDYH